MSTPQGAPAQKKIAGISLGAEPKKLAWLIGLMVVAIIVYLINSQSDSPKTSVTAPAAGVGNPTAGSADLLANPNRSTMAQAARSARTRRTAANKVSDRGVLKLRPVNGSQGNIDPTLRLDLLSRLQTIEVSPGQRNLFGMGASSMPVTATKFVAPNVGKIMPVPPPASSDPSPPPPTIVAQIPLKFYGFIQSRAQRTGNRGFFLKGDDVLVGSEGDVLLNQFRIVQLGVAGAVMEDTASKNRQTLPLVPEVRGDS